MTLVRPPLAGRQPELELLEASWRQASAGRTRIVVVSGEPGIGKTRLIEEFLKRRAENDRSGPAPYQRTSVMIGDCLPMLDGAVAYAPFVAAFERPAGSPAAAERVRNLLRQNVPGTSQADVLSSVYEFLVSAAADQPLLLVLEDMHWADRSTLQLSTYLDRALRRGTAGGGDAVGAPKLLTVMTRRDDAADCQPGVEDYFTELSRSPLAVTVPLGGLAAPEMSALLTDLGADGDLTSLVARSEGNPLFAQELAAGDAEVTTAVRGLLLQRLRPLTGDSLAVTQAAAVLGLRCHHQELAAVTGLAEGDLLLAVRDVVAASVLVTDDDGYRFRHALLHEVAYDQLLPGERQTWHRRAAQALIDGGPSPPAAIAAHLTRGESPAQALQWWIRAGEDNEQSGAPDEAAAAFAEAVRLWDAGTGAPANAAGFVRLLDRAASAFDGTGQSAHSAAYYQRALAQLPDEDHSAFRASLLARCAVASAHVGRHTEANGCLTTLETFVDELPDCRDTVLALHHSATALILSARTAEAVVRLEECLRVARRCSADGDVPMVLGMLACATAITRGLDAARGLYDEAIAGLTAAGDIHTLLNLLGNLQEDLASAGQLEAAVALAADGDRLAAGTPFEISGRMANLLCSAAYHAMKLGRFAEADDLIERGLPIARAVGRPVYVLMAIGPRQLAAGRFDQVEDALADAETLRDADPESARLFHEVLTELRVLQGRREEAHETALAGLSGLTGTDEEARCGRVLLLGLRNQAEAAELARARRLPAAQQAAAGSAQQLLDLVAEMRTSPLGEAPPPYVVTTAAVRAQITAESARVHGEDQANDWRTAAALWRELGRPQPSCYCDLRCAAALIWTTAGRSEVAQQVRLAYRAAVELDAQPLITEAEQLAKRARIDLTIVDDIIAGSESPVRNKAIPAKRTEPAGLAAYGLTERESEVLAELTNGLTNAQIAKQLFISPRTVNIHVTRIFTKLGVSSRVQAAGIAHKLGLSAGSGQRK